MWVRVGRDPESGPVFPQYEPPPGVSPAAARYITRMGFDQKAFAAALVSLGVKGHLNIEEIGKNDYVLEQRSGGDPKVLSRGEKAAADKLFAEGGA